MPIIHPAHISNLGRIVDPLPNPGYTNDLRIILIESDNPDAEECRNFVNKEINRVTDCLNKYQSSGKKISSAWKRIMCTASKCHRGDECAFSHSLLTMIPLNLRQLSSYKMNFCQFGDSCRRHEKRICNYVHKNDLIHKKDPKTGKFYWTIYKPQKKNSSLESKQNQRFKPICSMKKSPSPTIKTSLITTTPSPGSASLVPRSMSTGSLRFGAPSPKPLIIFSDARRTWSSSPQKGDLRQIRPIPIKPDIATLFGPGRKLVIKDDGND